MHEPVLFLMLAILTLLSVATVTAFILRKSKIPYTVILLLVGISMGFISDYFPSFAYLQSFRLSPELIFYVFLPTLIFESAFHINFRQFTQNATAITTLALPGMLISTGIIGYLTHHFLGLPWPFALLFGTIISATDPISVLALFKQLGAPKRLAIIIEGESLFNDGTALVLFGILLEFIQNETAQFGGSTVLYSLENFFLTIIGGLLIGSAFGLLFSKALDYVQNSKEIEITITLLLAHFTFIVAEYTFGVSGIIATVAAGLIIGNYGAYKISPSVKEIVTHFWDYTAFLANSLIFLMVGIIIYGTKDFIVPLLPSIGLVILFTLVARAIMVYAILPILNLTQRKNRIPAKWFHLIQWSGIRGALAIALVLTLPTEMAYYNQILIFTVSIVLFTTVFNGFTISPLLSFLGLKSFSILERFQYDESRMLINRKVEKKLKEMRAKKFVSENTYNKVMNYYKSSDNFYTKHIKQLLKKHKNDLSGEKISQILKQHLLGVEKQAFIKLYANQEITQELLNILLNNISRQLESITSGEKVALGRIMYLQPEDRITQKLKKLGFKNFYAKICKKHTMLRYQMFRARLISTDKVISTLREIRECNLFFDQSVITDFEKKYKKWQNNAKKKLKELEKRDPRACRKIQIYLAKRAAIHVESKSLSIFMKTEIANSKVFTQLKSELDRRTKKLGEF